MGDDVYARRWLLTGLTTGAVAAGLVMGDLTASAIDPHYRQVGGNIDDASRIESPMATQPAPVVLTPISSVGEWPDAAPPPTEEHAFDEPVAVPTYDHAEPIESVEAIRFDADPEPVLALPSELTIPATEPPPGSAPSPLTLDQPAGAVAPAF